MTLRPSRPPVSTLLLALGVALVLVATVRLSGASDASGASLSQLNSQLGEQQSRAQSLSASINRLSGLISSLNAQIALVRSREAAVGAELARDRATLAAVQVSLARARHRLEVLRARLNLARLVLSRQLRSGYENARPDLVTVVLNARGFTDLLERIDFLHRAQQQQQALIVITRDAKAQADAAARRLARLETYDRQIMQATALQARALAGMNTLLSAKRRALGRARAAQKAALAASHTRAGRLQRQIARIRAEQAAAAGAGSSGLALGPSGGWVIPYAIVLCESGGQNLPPNSAGASGYYQIIPGTWSLYGGSGPAAYLAPKSEQDAVASRIWNGGGASQWDCAAIVGIH